jgi:hypothetical protein
MRKIVLVDYVKPTFRTPPKIKNDLNFTQRIMYLGGYP